MAERDFVDEDRNKISKGWYINTLTGKEGEIVYFREIYQTGNSWIVEVNSREVFQDKTEVQVYRRIKDIVTYLEDRGNNVNWAKKKQKQLEQEVQPQKKARVEVDSSELGDHHGSIPPFH